MYRSFTNRVLGGVCGGLSALLPVNVWVLRAAFIVLVAVTFGVFALLYLVLWLAVPQGSLVGRRYGGSGMLLLTIILITGTFIGWLSWVNGGLRTPEGQDLFWPGMLLVVSVVFFVRQVRG